jgi:hypothetical protein
MTEKTNEPNPNPDNAAAAEEAETPAPPRAVDTAEKTKDLPPEVRDALNHVHCLLFSMRETEGEIPQYSNNKWWGQDYLASINALEELGLGCNPLTAAAMEMTEPMPTFPEIPRDRLTMIQELRHCVHRLQMGKAAPHITVVLGYIDMTSPDKDSMERYTGVVGAPFLTDSVYTSIGRQILLNNK